MFDLSVFKSLFIGLFLMIAAILLGIDFPKEKEQQEKASFILLDVSIETSPENEAAAPPSAIELTARQSERQKYITKIE
jgi:hypothetical protein